MEIKERYSSKRILIMLLIVCLVSLTSCYQHKKYEYYADENNFITVTAEISFLNETETMLYLEFSNLPESFSDDYFKIIDENWKLVKQNMGDQRFSIGDEVTFITAPRYFGDGYVMPIVAISYKGKWLLEYEQGYPNFLNTLYEAN